MFRRSNVWAMVVKCVAMRANFSAVQVNLGAMLANFGAMRANFGATPHLKVATPLEDDHLPPKMVTPRLKTATPFLEMPTQSPKSTRAEKCQLHNKDNCRLSVNMGATMPEKQSPPQ